MTLIKLIINNNEYIELTKKNLKKDYNKIELSDLIEKNLNYEKDNMFYYDVEKFIKNNVKIEILEYNVKKKLYLLNTNQTEYNTYQAAVFCAYYENQALEMSSQKLHDYFINSNILLIGIAENNIPIGEVISSYHNG